MDIKHEIDQDNDLTINILPMIDVLFAILLFFVLSSLILNQNRMIEINRPKTITNTMIEKDAVVVSIKKNGELLINNRPSNQKSLMSDLKILRQKDITTKLLIDADKSIEYGDIFYIIEQAKLAKFNSVGLVTNRQLKTKN
tara:strand:+ start:5438 stop:5860 length:423 start_codon:yes stop_codon:yes gene_type:complete